MIPGGFVRGIHKTILRFLNQVLRFSQIWREILPKFLPPPAPQDFWPGLCNVESKVPLIVSFETQEAKKKILFSFNVLGGSEFQICCLSKTELSIYGH